MQDRFKFRIWNKNVKQFVEILNGGLGVELSIAIDLEGNLLKIDYSCDDNATDTIENKNDWVIMQCTGLKDKNGSLIYEGDIVIENIVGYEPVKKIIYWLEDAMIGFNLNIEGDYEIIGSIYENPELLEDLQ